MPLCLSGLSVRGDGDSALADAEASISKRLACLSLPEECILCLGAAALPANERARPTLPHLAKARLATAAADDTVAPHRAFVLMGPLQWNSHVAFCSHQLLCLDDLQHLRETFAEMGVHYETGGERHSHRETAEISNEVSGKEVKVMLGYLDAFRCQ